MTTNTDTTDTTETTAVGRCAWCDERIDAHESDITGEYIEWHRAHTGPQVFCHLFHLLKYYDDLTGEALAAAAADVPVQDIAELV